MKKSLSMLVSLLLVTPGFAAKIALHEVPRSAPIALTTTAALPQLTSALPLPETSALTVAPAPIALTATAALPQLTSALPLPETSALTVAPAAEAERLAPQAGVSAEAFLERAATELAAPATSGEPGRTLDNLYEARVHGSDVALPAVFAPAAVAARPASSLLSRGKAAAAAVGAFGLSATPAFAAAAEKAAGAPTSVYLWAAGGAFVGFLIGSIPSASEQDGNGRDMDARKGLVGLVGGALLTGGLSYAAAVDPVSGYLAAGVGAAGLALRLGMDRLFGPPVPKGNLKVLPGVNYFPEAGDLEAKQKAARWAYKTASFRHLPDSGPYAARGRDNEYGPNGPDAEQAADLREGLEHAFASSFDILVLRVRGHGPNHEPAVVVARSFYRLRKISVTADALVIPDQDPIPLRDIEAAVGYAWR